MSSQVSKCIQGGVFLLRGHVNPVDSINDRTKPEQFESSRKKNPEYKLFHLNSKGFTALHLAAKTGNILMINHIAQQQNLLNLGDNDLRTPQQNLVNLGDYDLRTPLFRAIEFNQRSTARLLIKVGADVNMQCINYQLETNANLKLNRKNITLMTPLSYAIEGHSYFPFQKSLSLIDIRNQKIAMAKLLLIYNGIAEPKLTTQEGLEILNQAQNKLEAINQKLLTDITFSTRMDTQTITTIIKYVPFDEIPGDAPETPRRDYSISGNG